MLRLSQSSLNRWFDYKCLAAWDFQRKLELKNGEVSQPLELGILVHKMLEGDVDISTVQDANAKRFYDKINILHLQTDYEVLLSEFWVRFPLMRGVEWIAKIDQMARNRKTGELVIIDFKTTGAVWKSVGKITPQARGFQAISYLIPPPAKVLAKLNQKWYPKVEIKKWPTRILYFVAGYRGDAVSFDYRFDREDYQNFIDTVAIVAGIERGKKFPKNRGKHCIGTPDNKNGCPFFDACFKTAGWKKKYKVKKTYG